MYGLASESLLATVSSSKHNDASNVFLFNCLIYITIQNVH